jgi:hypothetical protein
MYGMPQPNTYSQYGFSGYPSGAPGAGSPGMPQAAPSGLGLTPPAPQGAADPNAAATPGAQQQWPAGADPNAYYSNYWGGKDTFWPYIVSPLTAFVLQAITDNKEPKAKHRVRLESFCPLHHSLM